MTTAEVIDLLLLLGLTLRLYRLVFVDDLGIWWIQAPIARLSYRLTEVGPNRPIPPGRMRAARYLTGADCRWCLGFWLGAAMLAMLYIAGGPGHAATWWRVTAGTFTLNYVAAHLSVWAGDTRE
jgi:hypothetical protein